MRNSWAGVDERLLKIELSKKGGVLSTILFVGLYFQPSLKT